MTVQLDSLLEGLPEILEVDRGSLSPEFLLANGNWDSVAILSTIALIDSSYGITVSADELWECKTIDDIRELISRSGS